MVSPNKYPTYIYILYKCVVGLLGIMGREQGNGEQIYNISFRPPALLI